MDLRLDIFLKGPNGMRVGSVQALTHSRAGWPGEEIGIRNSRISEWRQKTLPLVTLIKLINTDKTKKIIEDAGQGIQD